MNNATAQKLVAYMHNAEMLDDSDIEKKNHQMQILFEEGGELNYQSIQNITCAFWEKIHNLMLAKK